MDDTQQYLPLLLKALYQAPGNKAAWSDFIALLTGIFAAEQGLFVHHDQEHQQTGLANTCNFEQEFIDSYEEYYQFINPYLALPSSPLPAQGSFGLLNQTLPDHVVKKTEFFNDYVVPQGLTVENAVRLTPLQADGVHTSIALHYPINNDGSHVTRALALCAQIMPHLQTALGLHKRICGLEVQFSALRKSIDKVPFGMVMLDRSGNVLEMNDPAGKILLQNDGLRVCNNKLQTMIARKTEKLNILVASVQQAASGKPEGKRGVFRVFRRSGKRPYELLVIPVYEQEEEGNDKDCAVVIFIQDPDFQPLSLGAMIQHMYGLTRAEVSVTLLLIQGCDCRTIGEHLNISRETMKTHLSHIFRKTQTRRQGELIAMILRGPVLMCGSRVTV